MSVSLVRKTSIMSNKVNTFSKAWSLLSPKERRFAGAVLLIVVIAAVGSAAMVASVFPFLTVLADPSRIQSSTSLSWAYARFGFTSEYNFLVALGFGSLFVVILANALHIARAYAVSRFSNMQIHNLSYRLIAIYLGQPYEYFLNQHSGNLSTRVLSECQELVNKLFRPAAKAVSALLSIAAILMVLFVVQPLVAFLSIVLFGGSYLVTYLASRRALNRLGERRARLNHDRFRFVSEALGGVKDIKIIGCEHNYASRYGVVSEEMAGTNTKADILEQFPIYILQAITFGGIIAFCILLIDPATFNDRNSVGSILPVLGVFAFAGQRLMPELSKFYKGFTSLQLGKAALNRVYNDLKGTNSIQERKTLTHMDFSFRRSLRAESVSYKYPNAQKAGIKEISFEVFCGERIGVVGGSGAGKSTIADILLGLLQPSVGRILVDDEEITETNVRSWQEKVGYVPQDIFLIDASIAENIALGSAPKEIDMDRLRGASQVSQLEDFVDEQLPNGFQTLVGERGVRLSGGQKQRIGIARALYRNADLIVFDEATSALDNLTERDVMRSIDDLPGDKTIFLIAHRLSTVRRCDRILVFDNGRCIGFDSWDNLVNDNEQFRKLVKSHDAA